MLKIKRCVCYLTKIISLKNKKKSTELIISFLIFKNKKKMNDIFFICWSFVLIKLNSTAELKA